MEFLSEEPINTIGLAGTLVESKLLFNVCAVFENHSKIIIFSTIANKVHWLQWLFSGKFGISWLTCQLINGKCLCNCNYCASALPQMKKNLIIFSTENVPLQPQAQLTQSSDSSLKIELYFKACAHNSSNHWLLRLSTHTKTHLIALYSRTFGTFDKTHNYQILLYWGWDKEKLPR